MKTLTTILMLCLPVAVMGETYVCTTKSNSFLSDSVTNAFDFSGSDGWVVDMDLGFRKLQVEETDYRGTDYRGGCQKSEIRISCNFEDIITLENIFIDQKKGSYTYSQHSLGGAVFSSFGTCTKI